MSREEEGRGLRNMEESLWSMADGLLKYLLFN